MKFDFDTLRTRLPQDAIRVSGGTVTIDVARLTGDRNLTGATLVVEPVAKLLEALRGIQRDINTARASAERDPVTLIEREMVPNDAGDAVFKYTLSIEPSTDGLLDNLKDPTALS